MSARSLTDEELDAWVARDMMGVGEETVRATLERVVKERFRLQRQVKAAQVRDRRLTRGWRESKNLASDFSKQIDRLEDGLRCGLKRLRAELDDWHAAGLGNRLESAYADLAALLPEGLTAEVERGGACDHLGAVEVSHDVDGMVVRLRRCHRCDCVGVRIGDDFSAWARLPPPPPQEVVAGCRVRILRDDFVGHAGAVGTVLEVDEADDCVKVRLASGAEWITSVSNVRVVP